MSHAANHAHALMGLSEGYTQGQLPDPPFRVLISGPSPHLGGVRDLARLCEQGCLHSVEQWFRDRSSRHAVDHRFSRTSRSSSPRQLAVESHQYDVVHLLLFKGYAMDLEEESPLNSTLKPRDWEVLDLLLAWGADPKRAEAGIAPDTYQPSLMGRFREFGLDLSRDHALAHCLAYTSSDQPAYG